MDKLVKLCVCFFEISCSVSVRSKQFANRLFVFGRWLGSENAGEDIADQALHIYRTWLTAPEIDNGSRLILTHEHTESTINKMESETADFAPGAATWRTGRNIRVVFDSGPFAPLCEKHDNIIYKTGSRLHQVLHCSHKRTAAATDNVQKI